MWMYYTSLIISLNVYGKNESVDKKLIQNSFLDTEMSKSKKPYIRFPCQKPYKWLFP